MPEIIWLPEAVDDLTRLHEFLIDKNPHAAQQAAKCILSAVAYIQENPNIGYTIDHDNGMQELYAPFGKGAYVLQYVMDDDRILLVRIWHSREERTAPPL